MSLKIGDRITGVVLHGEKVGRKLGFPTANIYSEDIEAEDFGVFIARVTLDGNRYNGVLSIGAKPTFDKSNGTVIECFIFDFNKEIYGKEITLEIVKFMRKQQKFDSVELLRLQIEKDVADAKKFLVDTTN